MKSADAALRWIAKHGCGLLKGCTKKRHADGCAASMAKRGLDAVKNDARDASQAEKVIARLYVAAQREGWEKGPTIEEAIGTANDWWYNRHGYDGPAASEALERLGGLRG